MMAWSCAALQRGATLAWLVRSLSTGAPVTGVLTWGQGSQGALGLRSTQDAWEPEHVSPSSLPPAASVARVGAGHFTSFAVTSDGQLYSWGRNVEHQLGRPLAAGEFECSASPGRVLGLENAAVASATGSGVASMAVTRDGRLLAWGSSKRGQLGLGPDTMIALRPTEVPGLPGAVTQVAVGWGHAVALLEDGSVWSWGWPAHGRLGHSHAQEQAEEEEQALRQRCVWRPRRVELLAGVKVKQVACGLDHTMCLAADGSLFTFGQNDLGQLGRPSQQHAGDDGEALRPRDGSGWLVHVESHSRAGSKFRRVAAGLGHCLGVMQSGQVLSWGWNTAGQCGLGAAATAEVIRTPTQIYGVPYNRHALIAAGRVHSVLATDELDERMSSLDTQGMREHRVSMLHCWGSARDGRLGTGYLESSPFPELVPDLDGSEPIRDLACGLDHTIVLVDLI